MNNTTALDEVLAQRGSTYGDFTDVANTYVALCDIANTKAYPPTLRCAMEMVLMKVARVSNGDKLHLDSWVDIAGYAQLAVDAIREGKITTPASDPMSSPLNPSAVLTD